jgi:hypothetical protein
VQQQARLFREGTGQDQPGQIALTHHPLRQLGRVALAARAFQVDGAHIVEPDRRAEREPHRQEGNAGGLRIDAIALQLRREVRPDLVGQHLLAAGGHAAVRRDAGAPYQSEPGAGRQGTLALQHHDLPQAAGLLVGAQARGVVRGAALAPSGALQRLAHQPAILQQQLLARGAVQQAHRDFFVDALDAAPGVALDAVRRGGRRQGQHEGLVLVDAGIALAWHGLEHRRPAGGNKEGLASAEWLAGQVTQSRLEREAAGHATRQVACEIVGPVTRVDPASRSGHRAGHVEGHRRTQVAEGHHRAGKARRSLAHLAHLPLGREGLDHGLGPGPRAEHKD